MIMQSKFERSRDGKRKRVLSLVIFDSQPSFRLKSSMFDIEIRAGFHVLFDVAISILDECSISRTH